jgi:hypothetical protein
MRIMTTSCKHNCHNWCRCGINMLPCVYTGCVYGDNVGLLPYTPQ